MSDPIRLHLGCEYKHLDGCVNVDFYPTSSVDLVADLSKKWPWENDSVDHIYSHHVFEHLDFGHTFQECWRVLKMGASVHFEVPHGNTFIHLMNPTHITHFATPTFDAWSEQCLASSNYGFNMRWRVKLKRITFLGKTGGWRTVVNAVVNPVINFFPVLYERFFMYLLPSVGIEYILVKVPLDYNPFADYYSSHDHSQTTRP